MNKSIRREYERWLTGATDDRDLICELRDMDDRQKEDAFYRNLTFGTGGLRGVIGAGTNRMNIYTVAKASRGLAEYINRHGMKGGIAVSYDSRIKSELFAKVASGVFAANGIDVYLFPTLMPTPCLSFAVRYYGCAGGVMITASHNPARYNGYKVYRADGCQITPEAAKEIQAAIEQTDVLEKDSREDFDIGVRSGRIRTVTDDCLTAFIGEVKAQSVLYGDEICRNVSIVYTPLNGTGRIPVTRALRESGFSDIVMVREQEMPDGSFPTCPFPNPELPEAMALGVQYAERTGADLLLATDPDCDRVGVAVREGNTYRCLTGNEVGMLLLDYICSQRTRHARMPKRPLLIKTVVTADMAERIARRYGVDTVNVLTGFKYIGEQIGLLEQKGEAERYLFGFEESYGYLSAGYVRDKDAVGASVLICEMFAFYKTRGIALTDRLNALYDTFGYCLNTLHSYEFDGAIGMERMKGIMCALRADIAYFGGKKVLHVSDYALGLDGLPKSDVLKFSLEDGCCAVVRPSGTEPKLKLYLSVSAKTKAEAEIAERNIADAVEAWMAASADVPSPDAVPG